MASIGPEVGEKAKSLSHTLRGGIAILFVLRPHHAGIPTEEDKSQKASTVIESLSLCIYGLERYLSPLN